MWWHAVFVVLCAMSACGYRQRRLFGQQPMMDSFYGTGNMYAGDGQYTGHYGGDSTQYDHPMYGGWSGAMPGSGNHYPPMSAVGTVSDGNGYESQIVDSAVGHTHGYDTANMHNGMPYGSDAVSAVGTPHHIVGGVHQQSFYPQSSSDVAESAVGPAGQLDDYGGMQHGHGHRHTSGREIRGYEHFWIEN